MTAPHRMVPRFAALAITLFLASVGAAAAASQRQGSAVYQDLWKYIDTIRIVDSHEHQRNTRESIAGANFFTILASSYLRSDLESAGAPPLDLKAARENSLEQNWAIYGPFLEYSKNTSYYAHHLETPRGTP